MSDSPGGREVDRISINVVPDTSGFEASLRADLDAIARTVSINVPINVESAGLTEEAGVEGSAYGTAFRDAAESILSTLPDVKIGIDDTETEAKLAAIRDELELLGAATIGVDISDADAIVKLDEIKVRLTELQLDTPDIEIALQATDALAELAVFRAALDDATRSRTVDINTDASKSGLQDVSKSAEDLGGNFSKLILAGVAIGPALVPVLAVVLAAVVALSGALAPLVIGFVAIGLALTGGTNGAVLKTAEAVSGLTNVMAQLRAALDPDVFAILRDGAGVLAALLPSLIPIVDSLVGPFHDLTAALDGIFGSDQFQTFVGFLAAQAGPSMATFGQALINIATGFANMMVALAPLTALLENGIVSITAKFADFGASNGMSKFVAYVVQEAPVVGQFLEKLVAFIIDFLTAAAPLGAVLLPVLTAIFTVLDFIVKIPLVGTFVVALLAITSAAFLLAPAIEGVGAALAGLELTAGPILVVVAAIALLAYAVDQIIVHWAGISNFASHIWNDVAGAVISALSAVGDAIVTSFDAVVGFFEAIPGAIVGAFSSAGNFLYDIGANIVDGLLKGIEDAWDGLLNMVKSLIGTIPKAFTELLGIFSPSRVMAAIGGYITAGLVVGMVGGLPDVQSAVSTIASTITDVGSQVGAVSGSTIGAAAPSATSTPSAAAGGSFSGTLVLDSGEFLGVVNGVVIANDDRKNVQNRKGGGS